MCKAALDRFTTALAAEVYKNGIAVNALAPWDNVVTPGAGAHDLVEGFALEGPEHIAEVWQLERGDLPHLVLEIVAEPEHGLRSLHAHPYVGPAKPQGSGVGHPQIVKQGSAFAASRQASASLDRP